MNSPRARWALAATALLLAIAALLAPIHPRPDQILLRLAMDLAHIPLFGGLTLTLIWGLRGYLQNKAKLLNTAALISLALIFLSEWAQPAFGRSASQDDAINGIIGIGVAWLIALAPLAWRGDPVKGFKGLYYLFAGYKVWFALLALLVYGLVGALTPIFTQWRAFAWQEANFPTLADFTSREPFHLWLPQPEQRIIPREMRSRYRAAKLASPWESLKWRPATTTESAAMEVQVKPGHDFTGVSLLLRGRARNWSAFPTLVLEIDSRVKEPRTIGIRVDDGGDVSTLAGRYQSALDLQPGMNTLKLPLAEIQSGPRNRPLNLGDIRRLALFTGQGDPLPHHFAILSARLE